MASGARVLAMCVTDTWASPALLTGTEGGNVTTSGPLAERGGRDGGHGKVMGDKQWHPTRCASSGTTRARRSSLR
jgi:hypothetical protein